MVFTILFNFTPQNMSGLIWTQTVLNYSGSCMFLEDFLKKSILKKNKQQLVTSDPENKQTGH